MIAEHLVTTYIEQRRRPRVRRERQPGAVRPVPGVDVPAPAADCTYVVQSGAGQLVRKERQQARWKEMSWDQRAFYRMVNLAGWLIVLYRWCLVIPIKAPADAAAWLLRKGLRGYPKARSFVITHAGGFVTGSEYEQRSTICASCPMLRRKELQGVGIIRRSNSRQLFRRFRRRIHESCKAESCGCPDWMLADLRWKRRLRAWTCPNGEFEVA